MWLLPSDREEELSPSKLRCFCMLRSRPLIELSWELSAALLGWLLPVLAPLEVTIELSGCEMS